MRKIKKVFAIVTAISCISLCGCNTETEQQSTTAFTISDIHDAVVEAYGADYIPSYKFDEAYLEDVLGITQDMYFEVYAEGPKVAFNVDTFIAIKARDGKADEVKKKLDEYRQTLINTAYPDTLIKTEASVVSQYGNYVFFTCLGVISEESKNAGDDAVLAEAKSDNKIATDIIRGFFE